MYSNYFLLYKKRNYWVRANLMNLHALGCPEHDLTVSRSVCLSVCLCMRDKKFVANVAQELIHRIS